MAIKPDRHIYVLLDIFDTIKCSIYFCGYELCNIHIYMTSWPHNYSLHRDQGHSKVVYRTQFMFVDVFIRNHEWKCVLIKCSILIGGQNWQIRSRTFKFSPNWPKTRQSKTWSPSSSGSNLLQKLCIIKINVN